MRKILFFFVVLGLSGSLWAADPLIGSWRLDVSKSDYWALKQTTVKELTTIYRELGDGMVEVSCIGVRADGTAISGKALFPRQGGFVKDQQGIGSEDISSIVTVIDPYNFYLTILAHGKQVMFYHSTISKDGKRKQDRYKATDETGNIHEGVEISDRH